MFEDCRTPPIIKPHKTAIVEPFYVSQRAMFEQSQVSKSVNSTAELYIPELNKAASIAHVFPGMANHSLLSFGKLCNEGYTVTFRIDSVTIHNS
jgi:hypothetical protein